MEAKLRTQAEIDRKEWESFLAGSPQGAIFADPGFMDIVAPAWQAIEVREEGKLLALMPLNLKRKGGILYSFQPPFAQFWGVFFAGTAHGNPYREYSWKRKVLVEAIAALPSDLRVFKHTFSPEFDYATPFHWQGFQINLRYTYRLDCHGSPSEMLEQLDKSKRSEMKQALKSGLELREAHDFGPFWKLAGQNQEEGKAVIGNAGMGTFQQLTKYLCNGKGGFVLEAWQGSELAAAGLFVVDKNKTIYVAGAQNPQLKKLGGMSLVLWEAITRNCGPDNVFDFEGSMIEPIEAFFRGFGARPVPFSFIQKNRLPLLLRWIRNSR